MTPRILVVYANPAVTATPVAPYGAERVAHAFRAAGCDARVLAPFLQWAPGRALARAIDAFRPDLVGFSVRNADDALVVRSVSPPPGQDAPIDTAFYLPAVRRLVRVAQAHGVPVLVGGAAMGTMQAGLLRYLGAEVGVVGPAEGVVYAIGGAMARGVPFAAAVPDDPQVLRASDRGGERSGGTPSPMPTLGPTPRMPSYLALVRAREGRVAVGLSDGCDRRCHFCVEPAFVGRRVRPRPIDAVFAELQALAARGMRRVWLAASELNVPDARHATALLRAIAAAGLRLDVQGFLQPSPVDDALLDAFEAVGVDPTALAYEFGHLDDAMLRAGAGPTNRAGIDRLVALYLRRGHRLLGGSMLLGAHPEETDASVERALAAAREIDAALPDGLGLAYAAGGRVYAAAPLGRWVAAHPDAARPDLYGRWTKDFVAPLVFCRPGAPRALLARIEAGLAGCRGPMRPLNAEAASDPAMLRAEKWVNLAVVRAHEGDVDGAVRAARAALRSAPDHPAALRQLALVLANDKGDARGAAVALRRLAAALGPGADAEVRAALAQLERRGA